jgi:mRNA interferase MazF
VSDLVRGRVIWFQLGGVGRKPAVVVSNNARNRALGSALVARITSSPKPPLASIVELGPDDPMKGRVLCDDLIEVYEEEVLRQGGRLGSATLHAVELGLLHALGITRP